MYTLHEISIAYSAHRPLPTDKIKASRDGEQILRSIWPADIAIRERFYALYLNRANSVLGYQLVSVGGLSGTAVDLRLIFSVGLKCLASSIILAHNHPSATMQPSQSDKEVTGKAKEAGRLIDIPVLDHLILSPEAGIYYSFADEGRL